VAPAPAANRQSYYNMSHRGSLPCSCIVSSAPTSEHCHLASFAADEQSIKCRGYSALLSPLQSRDGGGLWLSERASNESAELLLVHGSDLALRRTGLVSMWHQTLL
jgi:hypothetical protein